jgi:aspartate/methionine/tyrosine aminotransferase
MKELLGMADEQCKSLWDELRLSYTECRGLPLLREQLAKEYPNMSADNILCFAGAEEGIYCAFKTILNKNDHAIVVTPCYQSLKSIPDSLCSTSSLDLSSESGWTLDVNEVRKLVQPGVTKLIAFNFPHNPTGTTITPAKQQELIALAREFDLWLFCDEVYRGLERPAGEEEEEEEEEEGGTCMEQLPSLATVYAKGLTLGAVSKVYGLAGLRIGWIACQDTQLLQDISDSKHYLSICNSAPSEILALIALRAKQQMLDRNMQIIRTNEACLHAFLLRHPDAFSWTAPKGGCCGFMRIHLPASVDLAKVTERLVQDHGVLILPGENFPVSCPHNVQLFKHHFRVGLGRLNFPECLLEFERALPMVLKNWGVVLESFV